MGGSLTKGLKHGIISISPKGEIPKMQKNIVTYKGVNYIVLHDQVRLITQQEKSGEWKLRPISTGPANRETKLEKILQTSPEGGFPIKQGYEDDKIEMLTALIGEEPMRWGYFADIHESYSGELSTLPVYLVQVEGSDNHDDSFVVLMDY
jgi:hypothetical protein